MAARRTISSCSPMCRSPRGATSSSRFALARVTTPLGCGAAPPGTRCPSADLVDLVGYGDTSDYEGTKGPALTATTAAFRNGGGCFDTDDNGADFTTGAAAPRNSTAAAI